MLISVFTPTYNRSELLPRLYRSLCRQTFNAFEWVIVDDGSTDNTKDIIQKFQSENCLTIRYFKQNNSGKHIAINLGVKECLGELFYIADSDDILPDNSLEIVNKYWQIIRNKPSIGGICGLDQTFDGKIIGSGLPNDNIYSTPLGIRYKYKVKGDLKEVFKTECLKQFPFPEEQCEIFCPESLILNRFSTKYKILYFNEPIYSVEYQPHGLTSNIVSARMNSPLLTMRTYSELINYKVPLLIKWKSAINYYRFSFCTKSLKKPKIELKWIFLMPIGWLFHLKDLMVTVNSKN